MSISFSVSPCSSEQLADAAQASERERKTRRKRDAVRTRLLGSDANRISGP